MISQPDSRPQALSRYICVLSGYTGFAGTWGAARPNRLLDDDFQNGATHAKGGVGSLDRVIPGVLHPRNKPISATSGVDDYGASRFVWIVHELVKPHR